MKISWASRWHDLSAIAEEKNKAIDNALAHTIMALMKQRASSPICFGALLAACLILTLMPLAGVLHGLTCHHAGHPTGETTTTKSRDNASCSTCQTLVQLATSVVAGPARIVVQTTRPDHTPHYSFPAPASHGPHATPFSRAPPAA